MPELAPLAGWESFYVIIGSSAAALTGLMFVVIALAVEAKVMQEDALKAFATPIIVHFGAVLLLAAFVTMPRHTIASLRTCIVVCGIAGLLYVGRVMVNARRQTVYAPVMSDWIWHGILPVVAYACLLIAGFFLQRAPAGALYVIAAAALLLLYIGIHNAWDSAVWMTIKRKPDS